LLSLCISHKWCQKHQTCRGRLNCEFRNPRKPGLWAPIDPSQLPTPNSQLPTPSSQLPAPNSQLPAPQVRSIPLRKLTCSVLSR
jgi:hypothetical protein